MKYRNAFYFDGKSSMDFGLYISGNKTFNAPERKRTKVSIPGRNGDLIFDDGSFQNQDYSYDCFIAYDLDHKARELRSWLLSRNGYCRLEDDYHPDEYRLAVFKGPIDFDVQLLTAGVTTLTFDVKPQRFLKTGEIVTPVTQAGVGVSLINPTYFDSKPIIRVGGTGTGTIVITNESEPGYQRMVLYNVNTTTDDIVVDSEIEQTYLESSMTYYNYNTELENHVYPHLGPGKNVITVFGGIYANVSPRWYML